VQVKTYAVGYMFMMFHNMRNSSYPLYDIKVRQAVDKVLDRTALTQALAGGTGTRSFFPPGTPWTKEDAQGSLIADMSGAEALLTSAGWTKDANGKLEKGGQKLTLKVVAYPQRPGLILMHPVVVAALESLGITVEAKVTDGSSWDELDGLMAAKDYDLLMWAQHTLPSGDPGFFMTNTFHSGAGSNHAGMNSSTVDNLLDALAHADTDQTRPPASLAAQTAILDEVPVSMLCSPSWHVGTGPRLTQYQPWGSDYYIIHENFGLDEPETTTTAVSTTTTAAPTTTATITTGPAVVDGASHVKLHGLAAISLLLLASFL
jgi:peptide/nickel transport system substrate-binding protein